MEETLKAVYDEVSKCNRCGFCQAHCPIFDITGDERNVARGHNVHVRKLAEGSLQMGEDFKDPLFECLLCKACVANCFPAVRTDKSVIAGRAEYLKRMGQPKIMHFLFHRLLPEPERLSFYVRLAAWGKNYGVAKLARAMGILSWFRKDLDKAEGIVEKLPTSFFRERVGRRKTHSKKGAPRVAYFVGCGFNFVLPQVSEATTEVLDKAGAEVQIADNCCCGLPAYGYGDLEAARKMAAKNLETLEKMNADAVVTECGSCSAFLKDYPELFEDDPSKREIARRLAPKVLGFSEFMQSRFAGSFPVKNLSARVTYHDPCHMSRYQKVIQEPRALLKRVPGLNYLELPEADRCCGAAGSYNLMHYEQSMKVLDRKVEMVKKMGADILTTECPGCIIQLRYGVRRAGLGTRVAHLSELFREMI
ncbi:MAG: (Fe-S)-binding protein [Syntrophaceae bacterium]|nr:(Fe-S)-binding protein [Syntrophaceae bacterium]